VGVEPALGEEIKGYVFAKRNDAGHLQDAVEFLCTN